MLSSRPVNAFGSTKTPGRGTFRSANHAENTIFPSAKRTVGKAHTPFDSTSTTGSYANEEEDAMSLLKQRAGSPIKPQSTSSSFPTKSAQNKTPFHGNAGAGYRDVVFTKSPAKPVLHTPLPSVKKRFNYDSFTFNLATPALNLRPDSPLDEEQEQDSLSTPLPSSVRRMSRGSRMSMERSFMTPQNNGRHWDVSDISIELNDLQIEEEDPDAVTIDEDAEIEYMPPKVEVPYEPPFDFEFPDYKKVGSTFLRGYYMDPKEALSELPSYSEPFEVPQLEEIERLSFSSDTSEDSDDPFVQARRARAAEAPGKPEPIVAAGRPIPRATSAAATRTRPTSAVATTSHAASTTTTSRAASTTTSRAASTTITTRSKPPSRPATAAAYVNSSRFTTTGAARPVAGRPQTVGRATSSTSTPAVGAPKTTAAASTTRGKVDATRSQARTVPSSSRSTSTAVRRPATSTVAPKANIAARRPTAPQAASGAPATSRGRSMTTSSLPPRPTTAPGRAAVPGRVVSSTLKAGAGKPVDKAGAKKPEEDEYADKLLAGSPVDEEDFLFDV